MKTKLLIIIFYLASLSSCYAARVDGPYEGKIIDAETGQPIEGVVILGTWYTVTITPGGGVHNFYDAQETVTDKNGDFRIKGLGLKILSNIEPMDALIFKAGYEYDSGSWRSFKEGTISKKYKWDGNKVIIPLKKLTMEERKKQGSPDFSSQIPGGKMKLMLEEINKERSERGLDPYRLGDSNK